MASMSKAIALTRQIALDPAEVLRMGLVVTCALALIAAGPFLPF